MEEQKQIVVDSPSSNSDTSSSDCSLLDEEEDMEKSKADFQQMLMKESAL